MLKALSAQLAALLNEVRDLQRAIRHQLALWLESMLQIIGDALADLLPTLGTLVSFALSVYSIPLILFFVGQFWWGLAAFIFMTALSFAGYAMLPKSSAYGHGVAALSIMLLAMSAVNFMAWHWRWSQLRDVTFARSRYYQGNTLNDKDSLLRANQPLVPGANNEPVPVRATSTPTSPLSFSLTVTANGEAVSEGQKLPGGDDQIKRVNLSVDFSGANVNSTDFKVEWFLNGELYSSSIVKASQTSGSFTSTYDNAIISGKYSVNVSSFCLDGTVVSRKLSFIVG